MKTNEQAVLEAEERLLALKTEYIKYLTPIAIKVKSHNYRPTLDELLSCQQLGNNYFNFLEIFVGTSDLLGAHNSGLWVTGFAETCKSVLDAYVDHIKFLRSYTDMLGAGAIEPDELAFAGMQRVVAQYLNSNSVAQLRSLYVDNNLPVAGFDVRPHGNISKTPTWQTITSVTIGMICLIVVVSLAVNIPEPSKWQQFIFRGFFALALAAVAVIIPGFLKIDMRSKGVGQYFKLIAGGAIAIFLIIWLVNPPSI